MKKMVVCPICGSKYGKVEGLIDLELICFKCKSELVVNATPTVVTVEVLNEAGRPDTERIPRHITAVIA